MQGGQVMGALGGILCGLLCVGVLWTLVGAVILRAACALYNKMAASGNGVPDPSFGKAMGITLANFVAHMIVNIPLSMAMGGGQMAPGQPPNAGQIVSGLLALPIGFLVMAGMLTALLPTTFVRALLVSLCYMAIGIAVAIVIGLVVGVVILVFGLAFAAR